ncbi:MAG: type I-C CRISPR-associated endonuclease Cas1c [Eubacteriales bacterium]
MKHLLNTLFVTSEDIYLTLDGENVVARKGDEVAARYPLHTLQNIVTFAYPGASPALMGKCADNGIGLAFCTQSGRFLARVSGENNGNVLLRREQYRRADDDELSGGIARTMIFGKIHNSRWSIERTRRDHALRVNEGSLISASQNLQGFLMSVISENRVDNLRGLEGVAAVTYFNVFDELILGDKENFRFKGRSRRPPLDPVNAMLSFAYSLLTHDAACALESVGLDPYVGFLHKDRPGRMSLALDLIEELRPCVADRFVLTMINSRKIKFADFIKQDSGAVLLTDEGRKTFLSSWQNKKREQITHPYLNEKTEWGMVPYVQALLLARYLRGDLDGYPPFLWK